MQKRAEFGTLANFYLFLSRRSSLPAEKSEIFL